MRCRITTTALLLALTVAAYAQRSGGRGTGFGNFGFGSRGVAGPQLATGIWKSSAGDFRTGRAYRSGYLYGGFPFWWDAPYDGSSAPTQVYLMPAAPANPLSASSMASPPPQQDPLLIELRGDKYVRVSPSNRAGATDVGASMTADSVNAHETVAAVVPTVFVFRDGHREESSDYSIYDGVIHTRTQYWTDGSWTKQIPISVLNIPESQKANADRGVRFVLPSAANEVIVRP